MCDGRLPFGEPRLERSRLRGEASWRLLLGRDCRVTSLQRSEDGGSLVPLAQALFLEVTAEKVDQRCSISWVPQCRQAGFSASCSAICRVRVNVLLQTL